MSWDGNKNSLIQLKSANPNRPSACIRESLLSEGVLRVRFCLPVSFLSVQTQSKLRNVRARDGDFVGTDGDNHSDETQGIFHGGGVLTYRPEFLLDRH